MVNNLLRWSMEVNGYIGIILVHYPGVLMGQQNRRHQHSEYSGVVKDHRETPTILARFTISGNDNGSDFNDTLLLGLRMHHRTCSKWTTHRTLAVNWVNNLLYKRATLKQQSQRAKSLWYSVEEHNFTFRGPILGTGSRSKPQVKSHRIGWLVKSQWQTNLGVVR